MASSGGTLSIFSVRFQKSKTEICEMIQKIDRENILDQPKACLWLYSYSIFFLGQPFRNVFHCNRISIVAFLVWKCNTAWLNFLDSQNTVDCTKMFCQELVRLFHMCLFQISSNESETSKMIIVKVEFSKSWKKKNHSSEWLEVSPKYTFFIKRFRK